MRHLFSTILCLIVLSLSTSCREKKHRDITPWGTEMDADTATADATYDLGDIMANGELIMLTISGPETYFDYRDHGMGLQYMLCQQFAQKLGVSLRVELCKDTAELVRRLQDGDGDIVAFQLPRTTRGVAFAGARVDSLKTSWAVRKGNTELADTLNSWFRPALIAEARRQEEFLLSAKSVKRRTYAPVMNRAKGEISKYDSFFQQYASLCRWDWRLMAAQCYQESNFDPQARSWAGACGLMQIMPSTADHLGLERGRMFDPESNIAAAAKFIKELEGNFQDIPAGERTNFVLASYNGGSYHVRDAMALAQKHGKNPHRWSDVREFILKLREPAGYNDPVVKNGYMRGDETADYVDRINQRWAEYRGVARAGFSNGSSAPARSSKGNRFSI